MYARTFGVILLFILLNTGCISNKQISNKQDEEFWTYDYITKTMIMVDYKHPILRDLGIDLVKINKDNTIIFQFRSDKTKFLVQKDEYLPGFFYPTSVYVLYVNFDDGVVFLEVKSLGGNR